MIKSALVAILVVYGLLVCYPIAYYGSFVWESPNDIRFNEAWMGVGLGFIYGAPAWLVAAAYSWFKRAEMKWWAIALTCPPLVLGGTMMAALKIREMIA